MRALTLVTLLLAGFPLVAPAADFMFAATIDGRRIEGRPLDWTDTAMTLMGRDGQLHQFDPRKIKDAKKTAPRFRALSKQELQNELREEFADRFDFTTTRHYIVATPRASAPRGRTGSSRSTARSPTTCVCGGSRCATRSSRWWRSCSATSTSTTRTFARAVRRCWPTRWACTATTPIGSCCTTSRGATAAGTGRKTPPPSSTRRPTKQRSTWACTAAPAAPLLGPRGVGHAVREPRGVAPRRVRLAERPGQPTLPGHLPQAFKGRQAALFDSAVCRFGHAVPHQQRGRLRQAWALTFFLSETQPREFCRHLAETADRPVYSRFSSAERINYFRDAFGSDLDVLQANFVRWTEKL